MRDNAMQSVILWLGGIPLVSLMMKFLLVTTYSGLKKFLFLFSFSFFLFSFEEKGYYIFYGIRYLSIT